MRLVPPHHCEPRACLGGGAGRLAGLLGRGCPVTGSAACLPPCMGGSRSLEHSWTAPGCLALIRRSSTGAASSWTTRQRMTTSSYSPHPCQGDGQIDVGVRKFEGRTRMSNSTGRTRHCTSHDDCRRGSGRCLERNADTGQASRDVHVAKPNLADGYLEGSPH